MDQEQKLQLVKRHAPILWLHRNEAFHPVDAQRMVDYCDLYRRRKKSTDVKAASQPQTLEELAQVSNSKNCYLKMPVLDAVDFRIPDGVHGHTDLPQVFGPVCVPGQIPTPRSGVAWAKYFHCETDVRLLVHVLRQREQP